MKILHRNVGPIMTNCYLLIDEQTALAALIDPGEDADKLTALVHEQGATLAYILLTHGHYDHTSAVPALHEEFPNAKIYIHKADAKTTSSRLFPLAAQVDALCFYDDGDILPLGGLRIEVLHTPGHSKGSVVLKVENVLFSGDTLFAGSCGRVDLEDGSMDDMLCSLKRLYDLPGEYTVYPGHMSASILSREREYNMYMKQALK